MIYALMFVPLTLSLLFKAGVNRAPGSWCQQGSLIAYYTSPWLGMLGFEKGETAEVIGEEPNSLDRGEMICKVKVGTELKTIPSSSTTTLQKNLCDRLASICSDHVSKLESLPNTKRQHGCTPFFRETINGCVVNIDSIDNAKLLLHGIFNGEGSLDKEATTTSIVAHVASAIRQREQEKEALLRESQLAINVSG